MDSVIAVRGQGSGVCVCLCVHVPLNQLQLSTYSSIIPLTP